MLKAKYITLGCKLNQAETVQISDNLLNASIAERCDKISDKPDLILVNTCAVTTKAASKSRHMISKVVRENPGAIIVAAGCLAQLDADLTAKIPGVDYVLGTSNRFDTEWWCGKPDETIVAVDKDPTSPLQEYKSLEIVRSRSMLKIQDGCNCSCAYCIIPKLRGRQRSVSIDAILKSVYGMLSEGVQEIVLTGVRIGSWGSDFNKRLNLVDLLSNIISIKGDFRIRLGSIEPWELDMGLIDMVVNEQKICSHMHIPLQHTVPVVLKRMNRPANTRIMDVISDVKIKNPDLSVGADIITGFPGETEDDFRRLCKDILELPLTYLHVFGFSERPGTAAVHFQDKCHSEIIRVRVGLLREIGIEKRDEFMKSQDGRIKRVIAHSTTGKSSRHVVAVTDNYLKVKVATGDVIPGRLIPVVLSYKTGIGLWGKTLES